ncbi:MAG: cytochrome c3 family protein [Desulfuromonadales bacterium]|nr:cytochrome c3 family protein [Desulfuromonadales bacterium]MDW7756694.1 cytochrome c3 family protein [Desulfuromonadales bacterium]
MGTIRSRWVRILGWCVLGLLWAETGPAAGKYWDFPPLPAPHEYGNVLISRISVENKIKPVLFPHWSHRARFSCRVCHFELDFAFATNKTEITEAENRNGLYCGSCHDGERAFGHTEGNCERCHSGYGSTDAEKFEAFRRPLPSAPFGNKIHWGYALEDGLIRPAYSLFHADEKPMDFDRELELQAEWTYVPPAYFPHAKHTPWLDCANCHPDIFNVKKKTTQHFSMEYILEGKFCGVCHLRVAFPLDDCKGCHPRISR